MTKRFFISLLIAGMLLLSFDVFAQRTCASHDVMLQQIEKNPRFAEKLKSIEAHTAKSIQTPMLKATGTITLPVHVIVVYSSTDQNISDAQIQSQIDVLNLDYRKLNSDWTLTPTEFYNLVTDSEIEFTLQGIERHQNSTSEWGYQDAVKAAYPPYSPNTHLNIWVCNIGGGILGYAQFPGGDPSTDGLVIGPNFFGSSDYDDGSFYLSAPYDKGRTATHEVGHWLNLRHIWGDGGCGASDYVDDTPDASGANYGCPTHPHLTCSSNDMFMNYMDYVDDVCMYMFSDGQKSRMRAIFEPGGPRESFVSGGVITCSVNACDGNIGLSLTFDNYPSETSWSLTDSLGTVIDQGSGYTSSGSTITESWTLSEGQYTFSIYDSYGDGICCSYGSGSYSLTDGCSTLQSGGDFGSGESITFCVPGGSSTNTPPVAEANGPYGAEEGVAISFSSSGSTDPDGSIVGYSWDFGDGSTSTLENPSHSYGTEGTYTATLTVTDNGGATDSDDAVVTITSAGSGTGGTLTFDDFESGWGNWTDGGGDCSFYTGSTRAWSGSNAANIQDNSGTSSSFYLTNSIDVNSPGYTNIEVEFYFYANSMENGEDFWLQYFNGSSWQTVASFASGSDFNNSTFYVATVQILEANYTFPTNMLVRFMCDASGNFDDVYIDDITISASMGTSKLTGTKTIKSLNSLRVGDEEISEDVTIYPNPARNEITLQVAIDDNTRAEIYNYNGSLVRSIEISEELTTIDISDLNKGIYLVKVNIDEEEFVVQKLIVE